MGHSPSRVLYTLGKTGQEFIALSRKRISLKLLQSQCSTAGYTCGVQFRTKYPTSYEALHRIVPTKYSTASQLAVCCATKYTHNPCTSGGCTCPPCTVHDTTHCTVRIQLARTYNVITHPHFDRGVLRTSIGQVQLALSTQRPLDTSYTTVCWSRWISPRPSLDTMRTNHTLPPAASNAGTVDSGARDAIHSLEYLPI